MNKVHLRASVEAFIPEADEETIRYIVGITAEIFDNEKDKDFLEQLKEHVKPLLEELSDEDDNLICRFLEELVSRFAPESRKLKECANSNPLVSIESVSLTYLNQRLLHDTSLIVEEGHIYGLIGRNGVGKSTLLNKIQEKTIPDFPKNLMISMFSSDQSSFISVEQHETGPTRHPYPECANFTAREAGKSISMMKEFGFTDQMMDLPILHLSGGWKNRLLLANAFSDTFDILLMDEPTNHLDVCSIEVLKEKILDLKKTKAFVITSHDRSFLKSICTDIIHYANLKLVYHPITFLQKVESDFGDESCLDHQQSFSDKLMIRLPKPGPIEGLKTNNKAIIKLSDVSFCFQKESKDDNLTSFSASSSCPSATQGYNDQRAFTLRNISCKIMPHSRIGMHGPNNAGKSTLLRLIIGELEATTGDVYRHENIRISYIAQHHVKHLSEYTEMTPIQYFEKRFSKGIDSETGGDSSAQGHIFPATATQIESLNFSEYLQQSSRFSDTLGPSNGRDNGGFAVKQIISRRKRGNSYEYLISWDPPNQRDDSWVEKSHILNFAGKRVIDLFDQHWAQRNAGVDSRPLHHSEILCQLDDMGISESIARGNISCMSAGQRTKLVLAASMWIKPHVLVMDEPTNFLDVNTLAALKNSFLRFSGAVIIVSHMENFIKDFAGESWELNKGVLRVVETCAPPPERVDLDSL